MKKIKETKWAFALAAVYCLLIGWIILFKMSVSLSQIPRIRCINLIPFYYEEETPFHLSEVVLNVLAFIPLGIYLRLLRIDAKKAVLLGFGFSFILEMMQFILKVGVTDITDLITNTSGVVIGVLIYGALSKLFKQKDAVDQVLKILATIGTEMLIAFMLITIIRNR